MLLQYKYQNVENGPQKRCTLHTTLSGNTVIKLTFCLVRINGSVRAVAASELPRVSANRAALFFSFNPSAAVMVN